LDEALEEMATLQESSGQVLACDGCGRIDAGPGIDLPVQTYVVADPNVGSNMARQYCAACANNRRLVGNPSIPN
jgi:hypothetical protein